MSADLKIWMNGELVPQANATVSVFDHGLLYGDGVFEGIRAYDGHIFEERAHINRLFESAKALRLTIPYTPDELSKAMHDALAANGLSDGYLRLVVTRGVGDLGLDPNRCSRATVFCIASTIRIYPQEMYDNGMSIITSSWTKNHPNATPPRVKSLNYLNSVLAKIEANDAGVPEAVMLNHLGQVAECTADNIFVVEGTTVYTPPKADGILDGVTRAVVLRIAGQIGIDAAERTLIRHDLYSAAECFLTGTAAEVIPVTRIDGRPIGRGVPGPITRKLKTAFEAYCRGSRAKTAAHASAVQAPA
ncbi:MAG: branched-chain-amino-acid transaminase [Planctomycetota bacterium]